MNQQLLDNNYLWIPNFVSTEEANNLAQEFFIAQRDGKCAVDPQCPKSPAIYNFFPFVKVLVKKVPEVSKLVHQDVLPTYTYGRIYQNGEVLDRHRDRDACEISLTVNLQQFGGSWPIWIQKPNKEEVSLNLKPGDAMLYLGCIADHWREEYKGISYVQVFLHYVLANGSCSYTFFDKQRQKCQ